MKNKYTIGQQVKRKGGFYSTVIAMCYNEYRKQWTYVLAGSIESNILEEDIQQPTEEESFTYFR